MPKSVGRRTFSSGETYEEIVAGKNMWLKTSIAGFLAIVVPYSVYMAYVESQHHEHEKKFYPHMKIRAKRFPWGAKDCDMFDLKCKAEARE